MRQMFMCSLESPVGRLELGATEKGVCLLEFGDRRALPSEIGLLEKKMGCGVVAGGNEHLDRLADELGRYFARTLTAFSTPLDIVGTPFQRRVLAELRRIPYGKTISYGCLAERIGQPGAQRAVGQANGANRIAIVVPCHRVVQSDGKLGGYGGNLRRKRFLLDLESSPDSVPAGGADAVSGACVRSST